MEFREMPKMARLSREIVITEKLDGTNASVCITDEKPSVDDPTVLGCVWSAEFPDVILTIRAGSRNRWITPENDNYGFARWVHEHTEELKLLGVGHHFGEWWGKGIQRGYGVAEKRFSLFNVARWYQYGVPHFALRDVEEAKSWTLVPPCCSVVPVLYRGIGICAPTEAMLSELVKYGSKAAPGFMDPEGIVVYHTAANICFKKTIKGDEHGKSAEAHPKKVREPKEPRNPDVGGRRKALTPGFAGPERRSHRIPKQESK